MDADEQLTADPMFLGMTRPAMKAGVTLTALCVNGFLTAEIFVLAKNPLYLLMAFPIHGALALLCAYEPRFFDLLQAWAKTAAASAYSPFGKRRAGGESQQDQREPIVVIL